VPRVIRAASLGYCRGVERALKIARGALRSGLPVYTRGPLIHNDAALARLRDEGIRCLAEGDTVPPGAAVVIRAHGEPPEVKRALRRRAALVADATCPRVLANQALAAAFSRRGVFVVAAGEKAHAETAAVSACAARGCVLEDENEAREFAETFRAGYGSDAPLALIAQTTFDRAEYGRIARALRGAFPHLEERAPLCPAADERQEALDALCRAADGGVVAGGRNSAKRPRP